MTKSEPSTEKVVWSGRVLAVQQRIRLLRSFDERYHLAGANMQALSEGVPHE